MKTIQIVNPKAGHGHAEDVHLSKEDIIRYTTTGVGDAENAVKGFCAENEGELHFIVCGGDGTINEVVNGIMSADAADRAFFSVAPTGSGNDFVKNFSNEKKKHCIDLIKYNGRYAVNMINIGFDCNVADKTNIYKNKKLISGSAAYILGVANVFCHRMGDVLEIRLINENGKEEYYRDEYLLAPIANGSFCGGGFNALPLAELNDGLLDMLIISKMSRARILSLIGEYRAGTYIDPKTKEIKNNFKDVIKYVRCTKVSVNNTNCICADGEIVVTDHIDVEIVPGAITYIG